MKYSNPQNNDQNILTLLNSLRPQSLTKEQIECFNFTIQQASMINEIETLCKKNISEEQKIAFKEDPRFISFLQTYSPENTQQESREMWQNETAFIADLTQYLPQMISKKQKDFFTETLLVANLQKFIPRPIESATKDRWLTALEDEKLLTKLKNLQPKNSSNAFQQKCLQAIKHHKMINRFHALSWSISGIAAIICIVFFVFTETSIPQLTKPVLTASTLGTTSLDNSVWGNYTEDNFDIKADPLVEVRSFVVNREDQGIVGMNNGQVIRQIQYDVIDEVRWNDSTNRKSNTIYSQQIPRQEVLYIPEQIN